MKKISLRPILVCLMVILYCPTPVLANKYLEVKGAHFEKDKVVVDWVSLEDLTTWYYVLEKSNDGIHYTEVQQQAATLSTEVDMEMNYRGEDMYVCAGITYYRVQRVNWNGEAQYSYAIAFKNEESSSDFAQLQVFPNPFVERFQLKLSCKEETNVRLTVTGTTGRVFWSEEHFCLSGENTFNVSFNEYLMKGTYFVKVVNNKTGETLLAHAIKNGN